MPIIDPPWRLDPLHTIVNVKWSGDFCFVATNSISMFFGEITFPEEGKTVEWSELPMSQFNFTGDTPYPGEKEIINFSGLSHGVIAATEDRNRKSVFIACGQYNGTEDVADTGSVFFMSNDGREWRKTLVVPNTRWPQPPLPIPIGAEEITWAAVEAVWDENTKAFYIAGPASKSIQLDSGSDLFRGEFMYSSSDGENWTRVYENYIPDTDQEYPPNQWPSPSAILEHCNKPENEGPLPDGYQAYNLGNKTLMKSAGTFEYVTSFGVRIQPDVEGTAPPATVTIEREGVSSSGTTSDPCWSVAYGNGVWAAGLGVRSIFSSEQNLAIDISIDDGTTWKNVFSVPNRSPMYNIIGGKLVGQ